MEKAYIITYDMNYKNNYELLEQELKKFKKWWHYLERTWIVISEDTPKEIWNKIQDKVNKKKYLLIIEVKQNTDGWLPQEAWEWIRKNITNN